MFLIFGIDEKTKPIEYIKTMVCSNCGKYGRYEIYMTYICFSIFFLPIIKWNKHYYVKTTCCGTLYELNKDIGNRIRNGENIDIRKEDLIAINYDNNNQGYYNNSQGYYNNGEKRCAYCGYIAPQDYIYCPKCGGKL